MSNVPPETCNRHVEPFGPFEELRASKLPETLRQAQGKLARDRRDRQDKLIEDFPNKDFNKRFVVVAPLAGLLRMTTEKIVSRWTPTNRFGMTIIGSIE
jgi:hypothetical protein